MMAAPDRGRLVFRVAPSGRDARPRRDRVHRRSVVAGACTGTPGRSASSSRTWTTCTATRWRRRRSRRLRRRHSTLVGPVPVRRAHAATRRAVRGGSRRCIPTCCSSPRTSRTAWPPARAGPRARAPACANIGSSSSYCMPAFGRRLGADAVGLFASDKPDAGRARPRVAHRRRRALLLARAERPVPRAVPHVDERAGAGRLLRRVGAVPVDDAEGRRAHAGRGRGRRAAPARVRRAGSPTAAACSSARRAPRSRVEPPRRERDLGVGERGSPRRGVASAVRHVASDRSPARGMIDRPGIAARSAGAHRPRRGGRRRLPGRRPSSRVASVPWPAIRCWTASRPRSRTTGSTPPPDQASGNKQPGSAAKTLAFANQGASGFVATTDGQAQLIIGKRTFQVPGADGQTGVRMTITPLDPATLGAVPKPLAPNGNAYVVKADFQPSGHAINVVHRSRHDHPDLSPGGQLGPDTSRPHDPLVEGRPHVDQAPLAGRSPGPAGLQHGARARLLRDRL